MGLVAESHARKHTQIDQPRLLGPAYQIHLQAQLLLQRHQKIPAVGGLSHGAGGRRDDLLHPMAKGQIAIVAQGAESSLDRLGTEVTAMGIPFAEPGGGLLSQHHAETAQLRIHLCHQQVNRVGADVDRRHPTATGLLKVGGLNHRARQLPQGRYFATHCPSHRHT